MGSNSGSAAPFCAARLTGPVYVYADHQQLIWTLGNLTLLTAANNRTFQNDEFGVKCQNLNSRAVHFASAGMLYSTAFPRKRLGHLKSAESAVNTSSGKL